MTLESVAEGLRLGRLRLADCLSWIGLPFRGTGPTTGS